MEILRDHAVDGELLCPACHGTIASDAVVCVHCGYNVKTGKSPRRRRMACRQGPSRFWNGVCTIAKRAILLACLVFAVGWTITRPVKTDPGIRHPIGTARCSACAGHGTTNCPVCNGLGTISSKQKCPDCNGTGNRNWKNKSKPPARCKTCRGSRSIKSSRKCSRCKGRGTYPCAACQGAGRTPIYTPSAAMGFSPWEQVLIWLDRPCNPNPCPQKGWRGGYPLVETYCNLPSHPSQATILEWGEFMPDGPAWRLDATVRLESKSGKCVTNVLAFWVQDRVITQCRRAESAPACSNWNLQLKPD